ncbi:hypothetical protein G195_000272 [Phytophthora kernoviae 00238/432]|uniref:GH16 domain-containing protein n=1 Tax=Phytophthora kernoviae 00238/432 TaxID=1284355 RepID=A0A8J4SX13_9STRA|nr:hypothetical protein G195_000272 [Phytophthora kernoviae 00238/432]
MQIRIGYPLNGQAGGNIGNNFVNYTFIGNPNAPRPDVSDQEDIAIGTPTDPAISGMNLIWQDEFTGTTLDTSKWNYETGYYLNNDPATWGWGNAELQHYTNSTQNVFVQDGKLNIKAMNDSKSFPQDPNRYAQYSSGKINTKDKLSLKYGRVDFRAKLPTAAPNNPNAPFDEPFYLIMNLAIGGNFDGGRTPNASDIPATMQVDYKLLSLDYGLQKVPHGPPFAPMDVTPQKIPHGPPPVQMDVLLQEFLHEQSFVQMGVLPQKFLRGPPPVPMNVLLQEPLHGQPLVVMDVLPGKLPHSQPPWEYCWKPKPLTP